MTYLMDNAEHKATIQSKLNAYADLQAKRNLIDMDKQALIDKILTPEVKQALEDVEAEFALQYENVDANLEQMLQEIKTLVAVYGQTVHGKYAMAVYTQGRVSWDTRALDGYAVAHPEVQAFRRVGAPSVSIRNTGG